MSVQLTTYTNVSWFPSIYFLFFFSLTFHSARWRASSLLSANSKSAEKKERILFFIKATEQNEVIPNYYLLFSFLLFFVLIQCEAAMTHALEIITFALDLLKKNSLSSFLLSIFWLLLQWNAAKKKICIFIFDTIAWSV